MTSGPSSDAAPCFDACEGGVVLRVHAQPGARRGGVAGRHGDALKVKVGAPPADGRANAELTELLATVFGVARSAVVLTAGSTNRAKRFKIIGVSADEFGARLDAALTAAASPS
ncbi:MAG: DUF167 domain-containing protein [Acidimicrobiia bacterium]